MPDVSILMASYNHEAYIGYAIESVIKQTFTDWELIIVDDASTDGTVAAAKTFDDPRIRCIANQQNQGQFATTNQALTLAQGRYLCVLNSDDAYKPDKLAKQVSFLSSHKNIAAVFTNAQLIGEAGDLFHDPEHSHHQLFNQPNRDRLEWLGYFFTTGNALCHPSVMIRAEVQQAVGPYNPCYANLADQDLWIRLCMEHDIHVLAEPLTQFRIRAGEANTGARKPASIKRIAWERSRILKHYLGLSRWQDVELVFPDLPPLLGKSWTKLSPHTELIPFAIAQAALQTNKVAYRTFALEILYTLMENPKTLHLLQDTIGFGYPQLLQLSGQVDPYQLMAQQELTRLKKHPFLKWMGPLLSQ